MLGVTITTRCMRSALCSCAISSGSAGSGVYTRPANIGNSRASPWIWVWQSQAAAGTSKFTGVCGCEALASAKRGARAAATAPNSISRLVGMGFSSKLVAAQAAVDRNHRASDVACERRSEEARQVGDVLGLAVFAHRDIFLAFPLAKLGRVVAQDLLREDAPRRDRIHRDAVASDLAREAFRPRVHHRLGGEGAVQPFGLGLAGDVDDAPPLALDHLREQPVRELALAREVERDRLVPLFLGLLGRELPPDPRVVPQDLHRAQARERGLRDRFRSAGLQEVLLDDDELLAGFLLQFFEQLAAASDDGEAHAFLG